MNYIKVIFGLCCGFTLLFSALSGLSDFVGNFIKEQELKWLLSFFSLLIFSWGYYRFEEEWRHYK